MISPLATIGIGPWDVEMGVLAWVIVPLLILVVLYYAFKTD